MADAQKQKKPEPVAYDRYWRVPVYNEELPSGVEGQYGQYDLSNSLGRELAKLKGTPEFINIDPERAPQSVAGDDENRRKSVMKHELAHVMQEKRAGKGGIAPDFKGPLPDMGDGALWNFLRSLPMPAQRAKEAAASYMDKLYEVMGKPEGEAYLLSDTVNELEGAPRDARQQEVLRRMQIEELDRQGEGKYTPIWKKPGEK